MVGFIFMGDIIINADNYTFSLKGTDEESRVMAYPPAGTDDDILTLFEGSLDECRHFMMELARHLYAVTWAGDHFRPIACDRP